MLRVIGIVFGLLFLILVIYPFAQDAYQRYEVGQRLNAVMDTQERAEFRQWNGDAMSFARRLYDRCELTWGRSAVQCERYRSAFE
jgi:hypothetical protein